MIKKIKLIHQDLAKSNFLRLSMKKKQRSKGFSDNLVGIAKRSRAILVYFKRELEISKS